MLKFLPNPLLKAPGAGCDLRLFSPEAAAQARCFHETLPGYSPTRLVPLQSTASRLGLGSLYIKDESTRLGLQSFKALGGSYAVARMMAQALGLSEDTLDFSSLREAARGHRFVFATATDGNHGRGIAWAARMFGQTAVVYMPKGSAEERVRHILDLGAECTVTDENYDDTVRRASRDADANGWILVQDTAWEGYEEIPSYISQGYLTLALEAAEQFEAEEGRAPTHIFLQAGVGSFAAAVLGFFAARYGRGTDSQNPAARGAPVASAGIYTPWPVTAIVEPQKAACIYSSIKAADGRPHIVGGDLQTIMAGLACGEPSTISWPVIRDYAHGVFSCADEAAALGMRILAAPAGDDSAVVSGESGAIPMGALAAVMLLAGEEAKGRPERAGLNGSKNCGLGGNPATLLGLGEKARCLLVSTEGATSPAMYDRIVWGGAFPSTTGFF